MQIVIGMFVGFLLGMLLLWFYRGLLTVKARSRQPEHIEGEDYFIVPSQEYQHLVTARDLTRAAVRDLERRRHVGRVPAVDPYKDRRELPRYQDDASGGDDMSPRGGQLKPGS
jgi:hypothetical protein